MTTRKPSLPPASHVSIATAVTSALADASPADIEALPAKVRDSLDYFAEVAEIERAIKSEQPKALGAYRDETAAALVDALSQTGVEVGQSASRAVVDALFSSHLMARLLADVAAGNIEPVATAAKTSKPTLAAKSPVATEPEPAVQPAEPEPTEPEPAVQPAEPEPAEPEPAVQPEPEVNPPVAAPKAPGKRARKQAAAVPKAPEPSPEPEPVVVPDVVPDDFDDFGPAVATQPARETVPRPVPASVPESACVPARAWVGNREPDDDDF